MGEAPKQLGIQYRSVTIERDALETRADNDPSIPVAISSETPVERHFGREVLAHDASAIDLTYARDGLPFLMNHDTGVQLGVVRGIKVGPDKVLRGRVLFGNHPDAEWVRLDMEQGIRQNISVGYRVNSMILSGSDSERGDEYTVDSWTPMEVSTVPVPADITVGVGRESETGALPVAVRASVSPAHPAEEGTMDKIDTPAAEPGKVAARSTEDIRTEIANIYALGHEHGCVDEAAKAVERGISRDRFASEILERKMATAKSTATVGVDLSEKDHKEYRLTRAILAQATGDWRGARDAARAGHACGRSHSISQDAPNSGSSSTRTQRKPAFS